MLINKRPWVMVRVHVLNILFRGCRCPFRDPEDLQEKLEQKDTKGLKYFSLI